MRIKLDENIDAGAAPALRDLGHDVDTVLEEGLGGRDDDTVWRGAFVVATSRKVRVVKP